MNVGWFGKFGWRGSKQTHVVIRGKKLCGDRVGPDMEFFYCGTAAQLQPECRRCKARLERLRTHAATDLAGGAE